MNLLIQPYPREGSLKKKIFNAIISGLIVTLFLKVFQPFGFGEAPVSNLNVFAAGYGLICTISIFLLFLFEHLFPEIFIEEKWTVGKNILIYLVLIFLIGIGNFYYTVYFAGMPASFKTFLSFQFFTLAVTFVVVSTITMIKYFRSLNFYQADAVKMEAELKQSNIQNDKMIVNFKSDNQKENLQLKLKDLYFIESADNYSKVFYKNDSIISSTLIRCSLKRLEEQVSFPELFRCHRSYLVQLKNVERVSGNSQGYRLHFSSLEESVPVSRNAGKEIHERIRSLNTKLA